MDKDNGAVHREAAKEWKFGHLSKKNKTISFIKAEIIGHVLVWRQLSLS